jgi:DNA-binding transcriptional MocR family regulator
MKPEDASTNFNTVRDGTLAPRAYLLIDETYRDATHGGQPSARSAALLGAHVITGASVSKACGAPGLRVGWLTVPDQGLRERLTIAKMNTVISGSPLDETLASVVIENRDRILEPRRKLLAAGKQMVAGWVKEQRGRVEWVQPDAGALCCLRLSPAVFNEESVRRFWSELPDAGLQLGDGAWFGESSTVFRLGFGYLPIEVLPAALAALSEVIESAAQA